MKPSIVELEFLKIHGVPEDLATRAAPILETALSLLEPTQRTAEFAVALAELRDGRIPTIVQNLGGL
jgi:hypothetical protein